MGPSEQLGPGIRRYDWLGEYTMFGGLVVEDRKPVLRCLGSGVDSDKVQDVFQLICERRVTDSLTT